MIFRVKNMVFHYASVQVLNHVSLELHPSEILGVLGPNGAGKSTMIRCLNKILHPQSGRITCKGKDMKEMNRREVAKVLGYVPQSFANPFPATVFDTVLMGRRPHCGWRSSLTDRKKILEILDLVGLKEIAMRDFTELSGGQQQKVVLARALAQETEALLLDEPTSSLDIKQQLETMEIVRSLVRRQGIASIMALHDLNLAAQYADRIIMLKNGRVYAAGDTAGVLTPGNIQAVFGVDAFIREEGGRPYVILKHSNKARFRESAL